MQHIIQRQTIEISTSNIEVAKVLQYRMDVLFKSQIRAILDQVFSSFSSEVSTIRIEKLELDLGKFSLDEVDTYFIQRLKIHLYEALKKEIQLSNRKPDLKRNDDIIVQNKAKSDLDLFFYYLQYGVLPWWSSKNQTFSLSHVLDSLLENSFDELISTLKKLDSNFVMRRLVMLATHSTYQSLVSMLSKQFKNVITNAVQDWLQVINSYSITHGIEKRQIALFKSQLLHYLLNPTSHYSVERLSEMLYQNMLLNMGFGTETNRFDFFVKQAQASLTQTSDVARWLEQKREWIISENSTLHLTKIHSATKDSGRLAKKTKQELTNKQKISAKLIIKDKQKIPSSLSQKTNQNRKWVNSGEDFYIDNAGIILLWPFLARYFATLNLIKKKAFIDENAQEKAVHLLHYLATGSTESDEHVLLLSKLLCGWPLHQPLLPSFNAGKQEKQESDELILSAISHWTALKNTSKEGLRQTFLQREGRLTEKDHGWELFINRTGFDVLLDQLPWGISTIHLPWMKKTVFVEW